MVCDSDGEPGLSWEEVSSCINDFGHLFKGLLFPEQDDFDQFDENQDGVLVFQEWKDTLSRPLNETAE